MLEFAIIAAGLVLMGGGFYLRRTMPWPFVYDGQKYRRMRDGSFRDASKNKVTDLALITVLQTEYEAAKYGRRDLGDIDIPD